MKKYSKNHEVSAEEVGIHEFKTQQNKVDYSYTVEILLFFLTLCQKKNEKIVIALKILPHNQKKCVLSDRCLKYTLINVPVCTICYNLKLLKWWSIWNNNNKKNYSYQTQNLKQPKEWKDKFPTMNRKEQVTLKSAVSRLGKFETPR